MMFLLFVCGCFLVWGRLNLKAVLWAYFAQDLFFVAKHMPHFLSLFRPCLREDRL